VTQHQRINPWCITAALSHRSRSCHTGGGGQRGSASPPSRWWPCLSAGAEALRPRRRPRPRRLRRRRVSYQWQPHRRRLLLRLPLHRRGRTRWPRRLPRLRSHRRRRLLHRPRPHRAIRLAMEGSAMSPVSSAARLIMARRAWLGIARRSSARTTTAGGGNRSRPGRRRYPCAARRAVLAQARITASLRPWRKYSAIAMTTAR
jgi:hypothetical protein